MELGQEDSTTFSWGDSVRACFGSVTSCLPSFTFPTWSSTRSGDNNSQRGEANTRRRAGNDELDRLLEIDDAESVALRDEDEFSLHSNVGSGQRRHRHLSKQAKRGPFGWLSLDLFGRRNGPRHASHNAIGEDEEVGRAQTSALLDVDEGEDIMRVDRSPTPLTDSRLEEMAAALNSTADMNDPSALRKASKEGKKGRKKGERPVEAQTDHYTPQDPMQSYQFLPNNVRSQHLDEDFGPFVLPQIPPSPLYLKHEEEEEEEGLDLDADTYTRPRAGTMEGGSASRSSGSGSHSHSRSKSHGYIRSGRSFGTRSGSSTSDMPHSPIPESGPEKQFEGFDSDLTIPQPSPHSPTVPELKKSKGKKSRKRSKSALTSEGTTTSSNADSASLLSPVPVDLETGRAHGWNSSTRVVKVAVGEEDFPEEDEADRIHGF